MGVQITRKQHVVHSDLNAPHRVPVLSILFLLPFYLKTMNTRFTVLPIGISSRTKPLLRNYYTKNKIDVVDALTVQLNEKLQQDETSSEGLVFLRLPHPRTGVYHILYLSLFLADEML